LLPASDTSLKSYFVDIVVPDGAAEIGSPLGIHFINAGKSSIDDAMNPLVGDFTGDGLNSNRLLLDNVQLQLVPEPSAVCLAMLGLVACMAASLRR
jgi:hypothetical protein